MSSQIFNAQSLSAIVNKSIDGLTTNQLNSLNQTIFRKKDIPGTVDGITTKKHPITNAEILCKASDTDKPRLVEDEYFQPCVAGLISNNKDYYYLKELSTASELEGLIDRLKLIQGYVDNLLSETLYAYNAHNEAIAERQEAELRANKHIVDWLAGFNVRFDRIDAGKVYWYSNEPKECIQGRKNLVSQYQSSVEVKMNEDFTEVVKVYGSVLASAIPTSE